MADEKDNQKQPEGEGPGAAAPAASPKRMWVRSALRPKEDGGNQVVLWERDDAHPNGEVLIAGRKPVEVGMTPAVSQLLRDGKIVETTAPAKTTAAKPNAPAK